MEAEFRANKFELRLLCFLERARAPREDPAAIGHRGVEKEREEVSRHVVVVTHGARVARETVPPAARPELRGRHPRGQRQPAGAREREGKPRPLPERELWGLPRVHEAQRCVDVVYLEEPGDEGAPEAQLAGGAPEMRD